MKTFYSNLKCLTKQQKDQQMIISKRLCRIAALAMLSAFASFNAVGQCVPPPLPAVNGSCPNTIPVLSATGLSPGGQGSNSSGVLVLNGSNQYVQLSGLTSLAGTEL